MDRQYRVREIHRDGITAVPLDGTGDKELRLSRPKRFIENEILVVSSRRGRSAEQGSAEEGASGIEVSASRIDSASQRVPELGEPAAVEDASWNSRSPAAAASSS